MKARQKKECLRILSLFPLVKTELFQQSKRKPCFPAPQMALGYWGEKFLWNFSLKCILSWCLKEFWVWPLTLSKKEGHELYILRWVVHIEVFYKKYFPIYMAKLFLFIMWVVLNLVLLYISGSALTNWWCIYSWDAGHGKRKGQMRDISKRKNSEYMVA